MKLYNCEMLSWELFILPSGYQLSWVVLHALICTYKNYVPRVD